MMTEAVQELESGAEIFKALGHPARLAVVKALGDQSKCVCDLQALLGYDMSTVSKHLSVLKHAGLVKADKRGKQVFYSLKLRCALSFLDCVERALCERGEC